jgi:glycosyltransferase involved in cell wall biosynthesis
MDKIKVLYISHLREGTGWAKAALDNIYALREAGIEVVSRTVQLTNTYADIPKEIAELERGNAYDADYCIQHVLPHYLVATNNFVKNIAYLALETYDLKHLGWRTALDLVDEVWCPNDDLKDALIKSGLRAKTIHHASETYKYLKKYPEITIPELDHTFKFYTICDLNDRKNIESTIRCFHSAFDISYPVSLILKVKKFGMSKEELSNYMNRLCYKVKKELRMYSKIESYNQELVLTENMTDQEIMSLHQYGDCYINTSHGEGWSIPTFDAMAMGKTPIAAMSGGQKEYVQNINHGTLVNYSYDICNCSDSAFRDMFTGKDYWIKPDEKAIVEAMRFYYNNRKDRSSECIKQAKKYSHLNIGKKMKEQLECQ